jgi:phosphopantothenoylcysteine decarboxylase/phosphopantothenate--cysteine ligase
MDHDMWRHPATQANLEKLRGFGYAVLPPAHGELASGLVGEGRLPEPAEVAAFVARWLAERAEGAESGMPPALSALPPPLAGRTVLVTAGPTREPIDPVRFLSNGSTGTMGFALAAEAARRGARVTLLAGPVALETPPGVRRVDVGTADELLAAALAETEAAPPDLVLAAAAVADYAPAAPSERKHKKRDDGSDLTLALRRTPDVLATLGARRRPGQVLVGFALETHDGEAHAMDKLRRKRLDWIVLNPASEPGAGFGTGTNRVTLLAADGRRVALPQAHKTAVAAAILDHVTAPAPA